MFGKGKEWDCYKNLVDQYTQTGDVMDAIFSEFDDDRSGFIDSKELKMLGFALGFPMDDAEVDMCVKDLDSNRDGKISLAEFRDWWLSGRQGLS
jgi:Ca2+-binding EF-hand superfamily protein